MCEGPAGGLGEVPDEFAGGASIGDGIDGLRGVGVFGPMVVDDGEGEGLEVWAQGELEAVGGGAIGQAEEVAFLGFVVVGREDGGGSV